MTAECVRRVKEFFDRDPIRAGEIDAQMREAVMTAESALREKGDESFEKLARSIHTARKCFTEWGLCEGPLERHMQRLTDAGASAVKPTGSGGGGYVLSLWREEPSFDLKSDLIALPIL